ncbi:MAG: hypothetical protein HBSAPP03_15680 [Phycisphaerae bacterium]|nr:MAG: hypothetical protein HBSAPP03_15680 [Phycisphaerae bacterium]
MLGRRLDPAVDDHEPRVFAEFDAGDAADGRDRAAHAVMGEPQVLGAVRHIDLEAGDLDGGDAVAGLEVFDGGDAAVGQADERAEEEAVRTPTSTAASTPATTTSASSAATRSATAGASAAGAARPARARAAARPAA